MGTHCKRFVNTTVTATLKEPVTVVSEHSRFPGKSEKLTYATATLFSSGKVVLVGAKCKEEISMSLEEIRCRYGIVYDVQLRNVVGTFNFGTRLNLAKLSQYIKCEYNPDHYHAMVVKICIGITCLLFYSGKIIITGAGSFEECSKAINIISSDIQTAQWKYLLYSHMLGDSS